MTVTGEDLETVFKRYADQPFLFVRPGGNWGDELIYWGAKKLADGLSIRWREIDGEDHFRQTTDASEVVYIHGGGGFNPFSSGRVAKIFLHTVRNHQGVVIQGPQTFATDRDDLALILEGVSDQQLSKDIFVFVRERASIDVVNEILPSRVAIGLNEDTAFYIEKNDVEDRISKSRRRYDLMAFRQDTEGSGFQPPIGKQSVVVDPAYFATSFEHWLRLHASARKIVTNRTHSAILGSILGIPTTLYAGRYHKNRSIWEYSLQRRGVAWLADDDLRPMPETVSVRVGGLRHRIENSWKVQRFGKWLQGVPLS